MNNYAPFSFSKSILSSSSWVSSSPSLTCSRSTFVLPAVYERLSQFHNDEYIPPLHTHWSSRSIKSSPSRNPIHHTRWRERCVQFIPPSRHRHCKGRGGGAWWSPGLANSLQRPPQPEVPTESGQVVHEIGKIGRLSRACRGGHQEKAQQNLEAFYGFMLLFIIFCAFNQFKA